MLGGKLSGPFDLGEGGPGGWWLLDEPEVHFPDPAEPEGIQVVDPDLAGWRRERTPELPETAYFPLAPDWICEVLSPRGDPRIFFLIGGQLHVRKAPHQAPTPLAGQDLGLSMIRLLAADIAASPLQILVSAKPHGASPEELWLLTVDEQSILAQRPTPGLTGVSNQDEFFKKYAVPRCLPGGHRCLVLSADENASCLDVEPTRGQPPVPFQKIDALRVIDAAWASADGESLYLLTPCS